MGAHAGDPAICSILVRTWGMGGDASDAYPLPAYEVNACSPAASPRKDCDGLPAFPTYAGGSMTTYSRSLSPNLMMSLSMTSTYRDVSIGFPFNMVPLLLSRSIR